MAEAGDLLNEFKKAGPGEKALLIGGVIGVVALMLYLHNQSQQNQQSQPVDLSGQAAGGGGGMTANGITTVPNGSNGQVPFLPPGYSPLYDANGNLISYQPTPPTTPTGGGTPPPTNPKRLPHQVAPGGRERGGGGPITQGRETKMNAAFDRRLDRRVRPARGAAGAATQRSVTGPNGRPLGIHSIPMGRPQRANPSLQRSAVTRTAARVKTRPGGAA